MMRRTPLCAVFLVACLASPIRAEAADSTHSEAYGNELSEIKEFSYVGEGRSLTSATIWVDHWVRDRDAWHTFQARVRCFCQPDRPLYYAGFDVWFEDVHLLVSAPAAQSFSADLVIPYLTGPDFSTTTSWKMPLDSLGIVGGTTRSTLYGDLDITLSGQAYGLASTGVWGTIDFQGWCDHEFSLPDGYEEESTGQQAGTIQSPYRNILTLKLDTTYEDLRNTYARLVVPAWNMELAVLLRQLVGDGAFVQRIPVFSFGGSESKYLIDKRRYVKVPYPRFRSSG